MVESDHNVSSVLICLPFLIELINTKDFFRYKKLGYKEAYFWFAGESMYNKSIVGWNGHSKDGKTLGSTLGGQGKYLDKFMFHLQLL